VLREAEQMGIDLDLPALRDFLEKYATKHSRKGSAV
jgi:hypothetical protein